MPGPYEQIMGPRPDIDPYSEPVPQMVEMKESMQFAPPSGAGFVQDMLYGQSVPFYKRAWDSAVDMLVPTSPFEMIPGVGSLKKTPKVVDFNAFKKTGKIQGRVGRPPAQGEFKRSWNSDIKPALPEPGTETPIEALKRRAMGQKREREFKELEKWETEIADEPYMGGFSSTAWGDKSRHFQLPIPASNVDVKGHLGKGVGKGGVDPFTWTIEHKYGNSKRVLEDNAGKPLRISTRSDLIASDDYMDLLTPGLHKIDMHVGVPSGSRAQTVLEHNQPNFKRRFGAANKLLDNGHDVTIVIDKFDNLPDEYAVSKFSDEIKEFVKKGGKVRENKAGKLPAKMINEIRELYKRGED